MLLQNGNRKMKKLDVVDNEWARLIRALGVLGETANASKIWIEAQTIFGSSSLNMEILQKAAKAAKVSQ